METIKPLIITITLLMLFNFSANSQDCKAILAGGIYDIHNTISSTDRASSFVNWFKSKQFSSFQEAKNYGFSVGISIEGLMAELGLNNSESSFKQFQSQIENYQNQEASFRSKLENHIQVINKDVVSAWEKCVLNSGMHFWIEQTFDPKIFIICAKYVADGKGDFPTLESFNFTPKDNIIIEDGDFFNGDGTMKNVTFYGNKLSQAFVRKNLNTVSINVSSSRGEGLQTFLTEQKTPLPTIKEFSSFPDNVKIGEPVTLNWSVNDAVYVSINNGIGEVSSQGQKTVYPSANTQYSLKATNSSGENIKTISISVDKMLNRKFYLKIYEKNNAGWFQPKINGSMIYLDGDVGYFPINSPSYAKLNIPLDNGNNLITCDVYRWRDANGDPGPRPYFFSIKFQIVAIATDNSFVGEVPITPLITENADWYGDVYGLPLIINPKLTSQELFNINNKQYSEWKTTHGH